MYVCIYKYIQLLIAALNCSEKSLSKTALKLICNQIPKAQYYYLFLF